MASAAPLTSEGIKFYSYTLFLVCKGKRREEKEKVVGMQGAEIAETLITLDKMSVAPEERHQDCYWSTPAGGCPWPLFFFL